MTTPAYPSTLKYSALVDSWQLSKPNLDPLETDMEGGNKRLRSRPGDSTSQITFSIMFKTAEWLVFKEFVKTTLNRGTTRFTMLVWNGSSAYVSKTVQFATVYKMTTNYPVYIVTFDLWVYGGI